MLGAKGRTLRNVMGEPSDSNRNSYFCRFYRLQNRRCWRLAQSRSYRAVGTSRPRTRRTEPAGTSAGAWNSRVQNWAAVF